MKINSKICCYPSRWPSTTNHAGWWLIYYQIRDVKFVFFQIRTSVCKIRIFLELRLGLRYRYSEFVFLWLYAYSILYNMAFMWWCSILGPGRILVLSIAFFITSYVRRALQQKQEHQRIIYCMRCRSLLSKNSKRILIWDSNTEHMQIKFEF